MTLFLLFYTLIRRSTYGWAKHKLCKAFNMLAAHYNING